MPTLILTDKTNKITRVGVTDKGHAIRFLSKKLNGIVDRKVLETKLNLWLSTSMRQPMHIGLGDDFILAKYED